MRYRTLFTLALLAALFFAEKAHAAPLSLPEYQQQLQELAGKVGALKEHPEQAKKVEAELPETVSVNAGGKEYSISYKDLKYNLAELAGANEDKRQTLFADISEYVQRLSTEAGKYSQSSSGYDAEHEKLNAILARGEFAKVRGPGVLDRLLSRVYHWLGRILEKLFSVKSLRSETSHTIVYVLIGVVFVLLAVWIVRRLAQPVPEMPREIIPFSPSAKNWRTWLAEARALSHEHDWRGAIHLAYWAGISFLEENGAWKPDRARTPREYLRLLSTRNARHPALTALTRKFEVTWYGHRNAEESDFQDTLVQLEKLGCQ
ncbi:MAG TPA: DUF4129 domain-containing protein [Candidatus Angelobacter sp.]|nr:DUF4129 domain-containing protein [Candidatus Angelobacter sp.]